MSMDVALFALGLAFNAGVMWAGFRGTHTRLDRVNGRLDRHDETGSEHGERIARLEARQE
jgi:hypothetical protein